MSILDKWKDYIPASSKGKEKKEERGCCMSEKLLMHSPISFST